jgi:acylphosphatase
MKQTKMLISGKVQGVFFRDFLKQHASKMGLKGYAKNLHDGKLAVVVQGDDKTIAELVKLCQRGPIFAKVSGVDVKEEETTEEFEYFDIRY